VSLLIVSLIAAGANASEKRLEKRGTLGGHGYPNGLELSGGIGSGLTLATHNIGADVNYLPPAASLSVVKKHYSVPSGPARVYGVPAPAPNYHAVAPASIYGAPVSVPAPIYGVPSHPPLPVFKDPVPAPVFKHPLPAPVFKHPIPAPVFKHPVPVPVYKDPVPAPLYGDVAPLPSIPSFNSGLNLGYAGLPSTSYGVPSTVVESVPSAEIAFGSAGHLKSVNLPSPLYDVPSASLHEGHNDGYSYPVPSKQLLI
ncbi:hypothetical protein WH47_06907, partial [Habropoda laboriosa]